MVVDYEESSGNGHPEASPEPSTLGEPLPCSTVCTLEELLELASMRVAGTIAVKDPHGHCSSLLERAVNAYDVAGVARRFLEVLEKCKGELECGEVLVLDVRSLPRRPRRPWNRLVPLILDVTRLTRTTVLLYTNDAEGRPRWINVDQVYVTCVGGRNAFGSRSIRQLPLQG